MPRNLPLGNGSLLLNFDLSYNLRDLYWPYVGQQLHTAGDFSRTGIWVDGAFSWLGDDEWQRTLNYEPGTLVSDVTLTNSRLDIRLHFCDMVDFNRPLFLRQITATNLADHTTIVRLFFHYDWYIWNDVDGNTVFYDPVTASLVAYKGQAYFLAGGQIGTGEQAHPGISSWATGMKKFHGAEGTWRDAEDGELSRNPIAQGSVDGTLALYLPPLAPQGVGTAYHWLAAGADLPAVRNLHAMVVKRGPDSFINRTRYYWQGWVNKDAVDLSPLPLPLAEHYKRSLLILRTQIDQHGAIVAANDSDILLFARDSYSYMWPRDGSLVADALDQAGYGDITRQFYEFCASVLTEDGYLLHKYNPDRSWGSSWHPWIAPDGSTQIPFQEDETALVLRSLWRHYTRFHDYEFVAPYYRSFITPAADFLVNYRDPKTGLPAASYDLWEERHGIHAFTVATVYSGLLAASHFSLLFGEQALAERYQQAALEIQQAARQYLWDEERGHFLRMVNVGADGTIMKDTTLDSSVCGLFVFEMIPVHDAHMESTMRVLEERLWVHTSIGGLARYENDRYQQVTSDLSQAQGNPWFISTLWLAQYRISHAETWDELQQALPLLNWAYQHALPSGVMAEQLDPFTGVPLSVSPLTWSHAAYVSTIGSYCERARFLNPAWHAPVTRISETITQKP